MKTIKVRNTPANTEKAKEVVKHNPDLLTIEKGLIVVRVFWLDGIPDTPQGIRKVKNILGFSK